MMATRLVSALTFCMLIISALGAAAETITIDSGQLGARLPNDFVGPFSLTASDFSIQGGASATRFAYPVRAELNPTFLVSSDPRSCPGPCGSTAFQVQLHGSTFSEPVFRYSGQFDFSSVISSVQIGYCHRYSYKGPRHASFCYHLGARPSLGSRRRRKTSMMVVILWSAI